MQSRNQTNHKRHRLFYASSYDRGLDVLLKMWPDILKKFPDATLDIAYGWDLFDAGFRNNPERMAWREKINKLMEQPNITHHGRVGKEELAKIRRECGVWAYPTYFAEINCITALDSQVDGLVPVTINDFALKETVGSGVRVDGDIYDEATKKAWLDGLFKVMSDEKYYQQESEKAREFAKNFIWDNIAERWLGEIKA